MDKIFTHDEACCIVDLFEELLDKNGVRLPSPEDEDRDPDNAAVLYGSTYDELLDTVEDQLIEMLSRHALLLTGKQSLEAIEPFVFSGTR